MSRSAQVECLEPALEPMAMDERVPAEELHVVAVLRPELAAPSLAAEQELEQQLAEFRRRAVGRA